MTTGNREADVTVVMRARDEASDQIEGVNRSADGMRQTFLGLNRTMALLGLGSLSLGLGLRFVVGRSQELRQTLAASDLAVNLLGDAVVELRDELRESFGDIADDADVTRDDVEKAFTAMALAAGPGAALNIGMDELAAAFNIAAATGGDFEEVAAAIGKALQGNVNPLRELLGVDMLPALETVFDDAALAAADTRDELTDVQADLRDVGDGFAELGRRILVDFIGPFAAGTAELFEDLGLIEERLNEINSFTDEILGEGGTQDRIEKELEDFRETGNLTPFVIIPPGFAAPGAFFGGIGQRPGQPSLGEQYQEWLRQQYGRPGGQVGPPLPPGGIFGPSLSDPGVREGGININIYGDVDTEQRAREFADRVMDSIREEARRGEFP